MASRGAAVPRDRREKTEGKKELTTRARSPSSSLMTAAKLLEVMSRNSQHLLIERLSHPDVGCSWMAVRSRVGACQSLNWRRARKSSGRVKRSLSRLSDELIFFSRLWGEGGGYGWERLLVRLLSADVSIHIWCRSSRVSTG